MIKICGAVSAYLGVSRGASRRASAGFVVIVPISLSFDGTAARQFAL